MALPSRLDADARPAYRRPKASMRLANAEDQAKPSPALEQQTRLEDLWIAGDQSADAQSKWSQRRTVAFIGLTCGGFWACVAFGVSRLIH